ncbi:MAG: DUF2911 domain-containing protein [Bacteroidetes bacterium]|nr:DUF2911 domain-containing protein [Bacteroidota bacterium]
MKLKSSLWLAILFAATSVNAQIDVPQPSPLGSVTQKVGLTDLTITYSRPGVKGRAIFGELVPFGEMWRLGANASTKFKTSDDIKIEGHDVPAGEYALYAIPQPGSWTLVIHKNTTYWGIGDKYTPAEDLVRIEIPTSTLTDKVESMTFDIGNISNDSCSIIFTWEKTKVVIGVKTRTDEQVMAEIEKKMKGVTSATYYQAARYYLDNDKDMNQALIWINKALEENNMFWVHRQKALILAKLGRYQEAIASAEESKKLAEQEGNKDYVRMNDKSIGEWTPLVPADTGKKSKNTKSKK